MIYLAKTSKFILNLFWEYLNDEMFICNMFIWCLFGAWYQQKYGIIFPDKTISQAIHLIDHDSPSYLKKMFSRILQHIKIL